MTPTTASSPDRAAQNTAQNNNAEQNRLNAQNSTGPVTPAGKEKVRFNAIKHGVCAQTLILPTEDKAAFDALGEALKRTFHPEDELDFAKLAELQECEWRLTRVRRAESNTLALGILEAIGQFADIEDLELRRGLAEAAAWRANAKQFNQFRRHENALLQEKDELEAVLIRLLQNRIQTQLAREQAAQSRRLAPSPSLTSRSAAAPGGFVPQQPAQPSKTAPANAPNAAERP